MSRNAKSEPLNQICVVVDTNTFVHSTLLLGTPLGAALLFSIENNGCLGMPEVLEQEIIKHAISHAKEASDKISRNLETLKIITGVEIAFNIPTISQLETHVENRMRALENRFVRVPFTLEHAKSSLQRVMEESPPNGEKDQQFKDSAIWEAVLELAKSYEVHFITKDKGFYHQRDPKKGLAHNLVSDCATRGGIVVIHHEPQAFLDDLKQNAPPVSFHEVAAKIDAKIRDGLRKYAAEVNAELGNLIGYAARAFLSADKDVVVISFDQMNYEAYDKTLTDFPQADMIQAKGSCFFNCQSKDISDVDVESVTYMEANGKPVESKSTTYSTGKALHNKRQTPFLSP